MDQDELRQFMLVLRRALLMVVRYIERRYEVGKRAEALTTIGTIEGS